MSSFLPLNLSDEAQPSNKDLEEEHSRELQLEEAFKLYLQALELQKNNKLKESYFLYEQIFKLDVVSHHYVEEEESIRISSEGTARSITDSLVFLAPAVKSLRYMVFKNRGFLFFSILKHNTDISGLIQKKDIEEALSDEENHKKFLNELFYGMIDDMLIALIYEEADEDLITLLYDIFSYLELPRLTRFALEYILSAPFENEEVFGLLPLDKRSKRLLSNLLSRIKENVADLNCDLLNEQNQKLLFLQPFRDDFLSQYHKIRERHAQLFELEVLDANLNWLVVIDCINKTLKESQDNEKVRRVSKTRIKDLDFYLFTVSAIERVCFKQSLQDQPEKNAGINNLFLDSPKEHEIEDDKKLENNDQAPQHINNNIPEKVSDSQLVPENFGTSAEPDSNNENQKNIAQLNGDGVPLIQRSSKRVKNRSELTDDGHDQFLRRDVFSESENFFRRINHYLSEFNLVFQSHLEFNNTVDIFMKCEDNIELKLNDYRFDFLAVLNNWNQKLYSQILEALEGVPMNLDKNSAENEKVRLMDVLSTFGDKHEFDPTNRVPLLNNIEDPNTVSESIMSLAETCSHYKELRFRILLRLIASYDGGERTSCLITDTLWDHGLYLKITDWIFQSEAEIMDSLKYSMRHNLQYFSFTVGVYEILVDNYLDLLSKANNKRAFVGKKPTSKTNKFYSNNLALELVGLYNRVEKWGFFIEQIISKDSLLNDPTFNQFIIRYKWALIFMEKSTTLLRKKEFLVAQLNYLLNLKEFSTTLDKIVLPNFKVINHISRDTVKSQITKISVLSILAKILYPEKRSDNAEAITLLEKILISSDDGTEIAPLISTGNLSFDEDALKAIKNFLKDSNIDMKLGVWNILFLYYDENGKFESLQHGFECFLDYIFRYLQSDSFMHLSEGRYEILLKVISSYGKHARTLVNHLNSNSWRLAPLPSTLNTCRSSSMSKLVKMLELYFLFSLHEEASLFTNSKTSVGVFSKAAYRIFKNQFVLTAVIFFVYFKDLLLNIKTVTPKKDESERSSVVGHFLCELHEQLGWRRLCDSADGLFLKMGQDVLSQLNDMTFSFEFAQLIYCRYHYKIHVDKFVPISHDTEKALKLDLSSTRELCPFVLPLCFRLNPLISLPKGDTKALIGEFYEVIGDPDFESNMPLSQNRSILEDFLEITSLSSRFFRDSFFGLIELDFLEPVDNNTALIKEGLYFLEGLMIFSSYKIRKKSTQSRVVELESVIMLLKNDLIYYPSRLESWFLLGQAYSFLVEDDLIWTSDKLTVPERKIGIANLQRKSLLCYLMAINIFSKSRKELNKNLMKPTISLLMSTFSRDTYAALMKPMEMFAFKVHSHPRFIKTPEGTTFLTVDERCCANYTFCLKVIQQALHIAIKAKGEDWNLYYYLAGIQKKLHMDPHLVLKTLKKSGALAREVTNSTDPLIEPHYKLCSMLYKFVKNGDIDIHEAAMSLSRDPILHFEGIDGFQLNSKNEFFKVLIKCLEKLIAFDKKKWHHKPRYMLAKILLNDFGKVDEAKEEMSHIVSMKPTSKTLVLIWKPENERPGKHFFYTYQYCLFFFTILLKERNLKELIQVLPRLRRSNSIMVSLNQLWEFVCSSICKMIRDLLNVNNTFTENFMAPMTYQSFAIKSKNYVSNIKENGVPEELKADICLLNSIVDMKKLNNGFGPTSLIDDTMIAIFVRIYLWYDKRESSSAQSPSAESPSMKNKKLAKRDFFPLINEIVRASRRDLEKILKEDPGFLNHFVRSKEKGKALNADVPHLAAAPPLRATSSFGKTSEIESSSQEQPLSPATFETPENGKNEDDDETPSVYSTPLSLRVCVTSANLQASVASDLENRHEQNRHEENTHEENTHDENTHKDNRHEENKNEENKNEENKNEENKNEENNNEENKREENTPEENRVKPTNSPASPQRDLRQTEDSTSMHVNANHLLSPLPPTKRQKTEDGLTKTALCEVSADKSPTSR